MKTVEIYTDGACSFNPGPGGWGVVMLYRDIEKQFSGFEPATTNNRMELQAVIEGISRLKERCKVLLYSDSAYVINAFVKGWIEDWNAKNWKNSTKKEVKNLDLWQQLFALSKGHQITWVKVKGHSDNKYNNICDELARAEIEKNIKVEE